MSAAAEAYEYRQHSLKVVFSFAAFRLNEHWVKLVCLLACRTGYENSAAAQAAAASSGRRGPSAAQYYYNGPDDFDPEEIFNMFFG
jgi:hypothetical protein